MLRMGSTIAWMISFLPIMAFSQHAIRGVVVGEEGQPLDYATVALLDPQDSILQFFGVTNAQGEYQIRNIKAGQYLLQFSFVGMQTVYKNKEIPTGEGENLGVQHLQPTTMDEVIVEAELIPVKFKKDTLEFDVRAFPSRPGAAVEEVLRQLPGVEVDNAGNIKAEGEEVVRVLVDGKEFFNDDPKVATKNLPAEALSKVQIIDRKSEEALFSGIDDGVREKTINLELKEDHRKGYFGNVDVGLGTNERYHLEGQLYRFTENTQHALLGMYNNINEFGFTNKDNNEFGSQNTGINTALAGGLNLSYNPTNQNRYFLNYLGNRRVKDLVESLFTENFLSTGTFQQNQDLTQEDVDRPHKINAGVRHNINDHQRFIFNALVHVVDSDIQTESFTRSRTDEELINTQDNETTDASDVLALNADATYMAKLNKDKNQVKVRIGGLLNDHADRLDWMNTIQFFDPPGQTVVCQFQTNDRERLQVYAEPSFMHRINNSWSMNLGVRFELDDRGLVRAEGALNDQEEFEEIEIPDFTTRQRTFTPTVVLNRVVQRSQLDVRLGGEVNQFDKLLNTTRIQENAYFFWLASINYRNEYRRGRRINLRYTTDVIMPTVDQLIPVQNVVNPLVIVEGNPDLEPEFWHRFLANWTLFDQFSFTALSLQLAANYTKDKIRWQQVITDDLVQINRPVNVEDEVHLSANLDWSTPLRSLGLNLHVQASENWHRRLVFINDIRNINTAFNHRLEVALENRKSDVLFVRLSAGATINDTRFSIAQDQNNVFFNTNYTADVRYTPNNKWRFFAQANVVRFDEQSFGEAVTIPLLRAEASYFFLKAERAQVTIRAFDLLNQFVGFQRYSDTNFLLQREWNTLTQYLMLSFNYRFR